VASRIRGSVIVKSHYGRCQVYVPLIQYNSTPQSYPSTRWEFEWRRTYEWNWPFASTPRAHSELCGARCIRSHLHP